MKGKGRERGAKGGGGEGERFSRAPLFSLLSTALPLPPPPCLFVFSPLLSAGPARPRHELPWTNWAPGPRAPYYACTANDELIGTGASDRPPLPPAPRGEPMVSLGAVHAAMLRALVGPEAADASLEDDASYEYDISPPRCLVEALVGKGFEGAQEDAGDRARTGAGAPGARAVVEDAAAEDAAAAAADVRALVRHAAAVESALGMDAALGAAGDGMEEAEEEQGAEGVRRGVGLGGAGGAEASSSLTGQEGGAVSGGRSPAAPSAAPPPAPSTPPPSAASPTTSSVSRAPVVVAMLVHGLSPAVLAAAPPQAARLRALLGAPTSVRAAGSVPPNPAKAAHAFFSVQARAAAPAAVKRSRREVEEEDEELDQARAVEGSTGGAMEGAGIRTRSETGATSGSASEGFVKGDEDDAPPAAKRVRISESDANRAVDPCGDVVDEGTGAPGASAPSPAPSSASLALSGSVSSPSSPSSPPAPPTLTWQGAFPADRYALSIDELISNGYPLPAVDGEDATPTATAMADDTDGGDDDAEGERNGNGKETQGSEEEGKETQGNVGEKIAGAQAKEEEEEEMETGVQATGGERTRVLTAKSDAEANVGTDDAGADGGAQGGASLEASLPLEADAAAAQPSSSARLASSQLASPLPTSQPQPSLPSKPAFLPSPRPPSAFSSAPSPLFAFSSPPPPLPRLPLPSSSSSSSSSASRLDPPFASTRRSWPARPHALVALDCEMAVVAGGGKALTRVGLLDCRGEVLLDMHVLPRLPIVDYLTRYSGVDASSLEGVTARVEDARAAVLRHVGADTIVVAHSGENDLRALRLYHAKVLDTAWAYRDRKSNRKRSLKDLARVHLKRRIQNRGNAGHDPAEDARAALDLAKLLVERGPNFPPEASAANARQNVQTRKLADAARALGAGEVAVVGSPSTLKHHVGQAASAVGARGDAETLAALLKLAKNAARKLQQQQQQQQHQGILQQPHAAALAAHATPARAASPSESGVSEALFAAVPAAPRRPTLLLAQWLGLQSSMREAASQARVQGLAESADDASKRDASTALPSATPTYAGHVERHPGIAAALDALAVAANRLLEVLPSHAALFLVGPQGDVPWADHLSRLRSIRTASGAQDRSGHGWGTLEEERAGEAARQACTGTCFVKRV